MRRKWKFRRTYLPKRHLGNPSCGINSRALGAMGAVGARRWAFAGALGAFHASELAFAATCTPHDFGPHSLLLSPQYLASMSLAVAEDALWSWAAPGLKRPRPAAEAAAGLGLVMVVLGEVLRKGALLSARGNFTHTMQQTRRQGHVLVSDGVYRHFRHPGYLGWWVWVVGTQVLMLNPLCSVLFFVMCRRFFSVRVHVEEALLRRFFGAAYEEYAARTPHWMPLAGAAGAGARL